MFLYLGKFETAIKPMKTEPSRVPGHPNDETRVTQHHMFRGGFLQNAEVMLHRGELSFGM